MLQGGRTPSVNLSDLLHLQHGNISNEQCGQPCVCSQVSVSATNCNHHYVGKWRPTETDVNSMVRSTSTQGKSKALMVDMGAFHLAEFAHTLCLPFVGSAVQGGVHVVQVVSQMLAMRMLMVTPLDDTFKVGKMPYNFQDHLPGHDCSGGVPWAHPCGRWLQTFYTS